MVNPSLSILICTRNRPQQLERCLKSVFQLNSVNFEIIVVDNGSKQFSIPDIEHPLPTRYFSQPVPGLSYARNLAVRQAKGEIVAFIDDDAVAHKDWVTAALANFEDSRIGCVTGKVLPLEIKTEWQETLTSIGWFPDSDEPYLFDASNFDPISSSAGVGCNFFVRKQFFDTHEFSAVFNVGTPVGGEDERYLFYQLIRKGWQIQYEPGAVVYHEYPPSERDYRRKILTYSISHSALLTHFLFLEKGERLRTWRYLLSRVTKKSWPVPFRIRTKSRFLGPFALIRSILQSKKLRPLSLQNNQLLASFSGKPEFKILEASPAKEF